MTLFKTTIAAIMILMVAESAHAVLIFTDRTAWNAAAGTSTTETFDNTIVDADSIVLDNGIVSTALPSLLTNGLNNVNSRTVGAYTGRVGTLANNHPPAIRWDLPSGINAWFADFGALNPNGLVVRGNWDGTGVVTLNIAAIIGANGGFGIIGNATVSTVLAAVYIAN